MCGIAGFITRRKDWPEPLANYAAGMAHTLSHRGPDDHGTWADPSSGLGLGHRRLSILDLSAAGHQPMVSASGRFVIVFNGEIYNHLELREHLPPENWRGHADTETLLECFQAWGTEKTLRRIRGMFALALWDRETKNLLLARDPLGEKPLYYGWQDDTFLFGSELRALRAHPAFRARIDRSSVASLLRLNHVPEPHSIFEGIFKLPPGCYLELPTRPFRRSSEAPRPYWSLGEAATQGQEQPFDGTEEEAITALHQQLGRAVKQQMLSDVPLGAPLSGGIDSSLITALMQENSMQPVRTFTIAFAEAEYDEGPHGRAVAEHLGTDHTELTATGSDALDVVPQLASIYDEPFADSSQVPTFLLMKLMRDNVTVALSGDGGDEMFGGYTRYTATPRAWGKIAWLPKLLRRPLGSAITAFPPETLNRLLHWMPESRPGEKLHKLGRRLQNVSSIDQLYIELMTEWSEHDSLVIGSDPHRSLLFRPSLWPALPDPVARMMTLDALTYLPGDILVKVDRAAMAVSLETRAPFLDRDVVQLAWWLPAQMKIRNGTGKWLLRQLLKRYLPTAIIERPKMGFGIPADSWLRGPLRDWAEDLLSRERLQREGYLHVDPIRATWKAHLDGQPHGYRLWHVLMFQAWLQAQP